jgi:hypothetical protein
MNKKNLIPIVILGGFILLGYFGGWWEIFYQGLETKTQSIQPSKPSSVIYNGELVGWDDQELAWQIGAVKIWESSDGNQVYFENINNGIIYTQKDGKVFFKAKWARWERAREELHISGSLEARRDDDFFTSAEAVMKYKTEELHCLSPVKYHEKDLQATADKMILKFEDEEVLLEGNVELIQEGDLVRAEGLVYWRKEKKFKLIKPKEAIIKP